LPSVSSPTVSSLSCLNASARLRSPGIGPALGGGLEMGVLFPQPLRFSLAQVPHEEK
jgi:hypothetical protein